MLLYQRLIKVVRLVQQKLTFRRGTHILGGINE